MKRFFHDIATPLSAVSLHLEGADRRIRRGGDPTEALAIARAELGKAFDLFHQGREFLLRTPGPAESVSLDAAVAASAADHPGVRVEGVTGGNVRADPAVLRSGLSALITNAVEASEPESVVVRLFRKEGRVVATVENPGSLPTDNPEMLFSPKVARAGRAWGMGLSRARAAAAFSGGNVRLEQQPGRVLATLELPEDPR